MPEEVVMSTESMYLCIVCGRDFRPAAPDVVRCPSCGGLPEAPAPNPLHGSILSELCESRTEWNKGDLILEEFRIVNILGEGAFGKVYLVDSERTGGMFAVKRVRLRFDNSKQTFEEAYENLMDELRVWADLPPFPHISPFRFFRTANGEIVIFTDYMEGGSLKDWIYEKEGTRRLYAGGNERALQRMLDLAIQFAWGLHFLHRLGYIHRDVKPGNALLTVDGILKVSDFGLVRAKGGSPAYAAPEQILGKEVGVYTDIWGWGVSVLEMFAGDVTWPDGSIAASILEQYLSDPPADLPSMPPEVAGILRRCFQHNPEDRWPSALEVAEALKHVYELRYGTFPRPLPAFPERRASVLARKVEGAQWRDPLPYLQKALQDAGRDSREAEHFAADRKASLSSQAVSDLTCYQKAIQLYEQLEQADVLLLAELYANQALVQQFLDDAPGALSSFDRAIQMLEKTVYAQGRQDYQPRLALLYGNKGFHLALSRRYEAAIRLYDQTISLLAPYVSGRPWGEEISTLVAAYNNKALAQSELGLGEQALATVQEAIRFLEPLASATRHPRVLNQLAISLSNQAKCLTQIGKYSEALQRCDQAIAIQEGLLLQQGRREISEDIAVSYMNKAGALHYLARYDEALVWLDKAIGLYEELILQQGQRHLSVTLSLLYANKADVLGCLRRVTEALSVYGQAITLSETLVQRESRWDLAHQHALNYLGRANLLWNHGQHRESLRDAELALSVLERLVLQEQRLELIDDLVAAYHLKARLLQVEDSTAALHVYDQALQALERHASVGNRSLAAHRAATLAAKSALLAKGDRISEALDLTEEAMELLEHALRQGAPQTLNATLADTIRQHAELLNKARRHRESILAFDRAIALCQEQFYADRDEWKITLGRTYHGKALVLHEIGNYPSALKAYDQAIKTFETLTLTPDNVLQMARAQIGKGATLARTGEFGRAITQLREARHLLETRADPAQPEVAAEIARSCNDQAFALDELQRFGEAVSLYDRAIEIREHLVHQHGYYEALPDLIVTCNNKAFALLHLDRPIHAIQLCDKAIAIGEKAWPLDAEQMTRVAKELSVSYHRKATILAHQGSYREAAALYEKSVQYLEPLVMTQERWEFCFGLANVLTNRGFCLFQLGKYAEGRRVLDHALEVIEKGLLHNRDPRLVALRQQVQQLL